MTTTDAYRDYVRRAYEQSPKPRKKRLALSAAERKAIEYVVRHGRSQPGSTDTLHGLLERTK